MKFPRMTVIKDFIRYKWFFRKEILGKVPRISNCKKTFSLINTIGTLDIQMQKNQIRTLSHLMYKN